MQKQKNNNIKKLSATFFALIMVLTAMSTLVVFAVTPVAADNSPVIWTTDINGNPQYDFSPGAYVYVHGTGFDPYMPVSITITRPDGEEESCTPESCHPRFIEGLQTTDAEGGFIYIYDLDGIVGEYHVYVTDGTNEAEITFTDGRTIDKVTLDGGSSVTVSPGATITVSVTVTTTYGSDWESTRYLIEGGSWTCVNTPDHTPYSGTHTYTESFTITAPMSGGIYDFSARAYNGNSCSASSPSAIYFMNNAITVVATPVCGDGIINGADECDDGNTDSGDGCSCCACEVETGWVCTGEPSVCTTINPPLGSSCGVDMVLILDVSGSIDNTELGQMKDAFIAFVDAFLPNTPTQIAVVEFETTANLLQDYTSDATLVKAAINSADGSGSTNWEHALITAHNEFNNRLDKPDLYVFASDGNPNRIGTGTSATTAEAVAAAVAVADQIKLDGVRIETLGIGSDVIPANLIAISSADAYHSSDFATLADDLADLADNNCQGTIIVRKYIFNDTLDDWEPAGAGWEFSATAGAGATVINSPQTTDSDGFVEFALDYEEGVTSTTVDVVETLQPDFVFDHATAWDNCEDEYVGTQGTNSMVDIPVNADCSIYCEFFNDEHGDETPPVQTFEIGQPNVTKIWRENEYFVVGPCTPIWINSTDDESGSNRITYSVWVAEDLDANPIEWEFLYEVTVYDADDGKEDGIVHAEFYLDETCLHEIRYQCWDNEGNTEGMFSEDLFVDKCTPVIQKVVGCPEWGVGIVQPPWVSGKTTLTFNAYDRCCLPGGTAVKSIHIKVWWKPTMCDDSGALNVIDTVVIEDGDPVNDLDPTPGKITYVFHFTQSGYYELEYWAEDIMCNVGAPKKQQHRVDIEPPQITKTHPSHGYVRINDTHGYLKKGEEIGLEAADMPDETCNVGLAGLYWRYEYDDVKYPQAGEAGAVYGADIAATLCCDDPTDFSNDWWYPYDSAIVFNEECQHDLYYFAIDNVCNYELHHQVYYVDDRAPYLDVTYPSHGYFEGDVDFLKVGTSITVDAYDNPDYDCQAGIESIFWRYEWDEQMFPAGYDTGVVHGTDLVNDYGSDYNIPSIVDYYWHRVDAATVDISFPQECIHNLTFFAKDNVCHHSTLYNLTFYLDDTEPELNDIIYPSHGYFYDCGLSDDDDDDVAFLSDFMCQRHLKCNTPFTISATDLPDTECAAGIESIFYRYVWDESVLYPSAGGTGVVAGADLVTAYGSDYDVLDITDYFWYRVDADHADVMFEEECYHELYWFAKDNVCHRTEIEYLDFYVDNTAPETEIEFPDVHGYYNDDELDHLKCGIEFTINANDLPENSCMAGIEAIFWRYEYDSTSYPVTPDPGCGFIDGSDLVTTYGEDYNIPEIINHVWYRVNSNSINIHFNEDCEHKVYWFAKDNVCHRSELYNHTIYVDCTEPNVWLEYPSHGYHQIDANSGYLKENTNFAIKASDLPEGLCGSGIESIFWRYKWDDSFYPGDEGVDGNTLVSMYGGAYDIPEITDYYWYRVDDDHINISFDSQCNHTIYYFAKDNVCQHTPIYSHTFMVDDEIPVVFDLSPMVTHGVYYDSFADRMHMKCGMPVIISSYDNPDNDCAAGIESIFYRYLWNDGLYPSAGGTGVVAGADLVTAYGSDYDTSEITGYFWYRVDGQETVEVPMDHECEHEIFYFAKDNVCHRTDIQSSKYYIDCSGPTIDVEHPGHGYVEVDSTTGYIKAGENINLTATDLPDNACASGIEAIFYRYDFEGTSYPVEDECGAVVNGTELTTKYGYEEPAITQHWWYRIDSNEAFVSFNEECIHNLTFFAKDNVCNHGPIYERTYYVDEFAPTVTKEHAEEGFIQIESDNYIKCGVPIWINATDDGQCDAGVESIFWRYEFDSAKFPPEQAASGVVSGPDLVDLYGSDYLTPSIYDFYWSRVDADTVTVTFNENCTHDLYYFAKDNVCHPTTVMQQTYYVDCAPPETTKSFDGPRCVANESDIELFGLETQEEKDNFWLRDNDTLVMLSAEDKEDPCAVGVDYMHVELWWDENNDLVFGQDELLWSINVDATFYEFKIMEDCLHKIVWYSVDLLGNVEETHIQYHRVDSIPPESVKTFNGPTVPADDYPNEMLGPDMGENYWITSDTEITLTAEDHETPCAVGVVGFNVMVEWDPYCNGNYMTIFDGSIPAPYTVTFTMKEMVDYYGDDDDDSMFMGFDCYEGKYRITWAAYDCLNNQENITVQYHQVDDTPPHVIIIKPTDGWYSDGESIPAVVLSEDLPNVHCGQFQCDVVGIENGSQGKACLIDLFPDFRIVPLDATNFLYDEDSHEFIGNVIIPENSGIQSGTVLFVAGAEDRLGNDWNSLLELLHAYYIQAFAECTEMGCMDCIVDVFADIVADFIADQNIVFVGIDNTPPEVEIIDTNTDELGLIYLKANITDVPSGIVTGQPCYVTLGGVQIGTLLYDASIGGCEGTLPTAGVPDGEQTLTVTVADRAGCMGSDSVIVQLQLLPGPTTSGTDVQPDPSMIQINGDGDILTVTATIHSTISTVINAEYFIQTDKPIKGMWGTGIPLVPVAGQSWGATMVDVINNTLDTTGMQPGVHNVWVHGLDDDGRWGAFDEEEFNLVLETHWRTIFCEIVYPNEDDEFTVECGQRFVTVEVDVHYWDDWTYSDMENFFGNVKVWLDSPYDAPDQYYDVYYSGYDHHFYADIPIYMYSDNSQLDIEAKAEDQYGNKEYDDVQITVFTTIVYDKWMEQEWNSLTLPQEAVACDDSVDSVLASLNGYYDWVWWYNPENQLWDFYLKDFGGSLSEIVPGEEYWIHMNTASRFYSDTNAPTLWITDPSDGGGDDDDDDFVVIKSVSPDDDDDDSMPPGYEYIERCEGPWSLNFETCELETRVEMVFAQIYDQDADEYWNGTAWISGSIWLECDLDYEDQNGWAEWYLETGDIWTKGHTYTITAYAVDEAGCESETDAHVLHIFKPEITVEKTVNGVEELTVPVGTNVTFTITAENTGDLYLYNVDVIDFLPIGLVYADSAMVNGMPYEPDYADYDDGLGAYVFYWYLGGLSPGEWHTVTFNATVTTTDVWEENMARAYGYNICDTVEDNDNASVMGEYECEPSVDLEKTVWRESMCYWDEYTEVDVGDVVRFNITMNIPEDGCPLYGGVVEDYLPYGLDYIEGSTNMTYIWGEYSEHVYGSGYDPQQIPDMDYMILRWGEAPGDDDDDDSSEMPAGMIIYLEFEAMVEECGEYENVANVTSWYDCCNMVSDEDDAYVWVYCEQCTPSYAIKKYSYYWSYEQWDGVYAFARNDDNYAMFKIEFNVTEDCPIVGDIYIRDELPESLIYDGNHHVDAPAGLTLTASYYDPGTHSMYFNFTGTMNADEQIIITFNASFIGSCDEKYLELNTAYGSTNIPDTSTVSDDVGIYYNWWLVADWNLGKYTYNYTDDSYDSHEYARQSDNQGQFKIVLYNDGECTLTDPMIRDELPSTLQWNSTISVDCPAGMTYTHQYNENTGDVDYHWWNFTGKLPVGERIVIIFDANFVGCCEDFDTNHAYSSCVEQSAEKGTYSIINYWLV